MYWITTPCECGIGKICPLSQSVVVFSLQGATACETEPQRLKLTIGKVPAGCPGE